MQYTSLEDDTLSLQVDKGEDSQNGSNGNSKKSNSKSTLKGELAEPLTGSISEDIELQPNGMMQIGGKDASEDDPFYVFKDDLTRKLGLMEGALSTYLGIIHKTDTAVNAHEIKDSKKQIKRHIKHSESTLKDLQTIIKLVEKQRDKFANITEDELGTRVSFVTEALSQISQVKQAMNSETVKNKIAADERALAIRRAGGANLNGQSEKEKENTAFLVDNSTQAQLMMRQQDETLDDLDDAVLRVGTMADNIHLEIESQNKLLDNLDDDLQDAEERLGLVMGRLGQLLKTQNKCQLGTILTLVVVAIVLFFFVLYS